MPMFSMEEMIANDMKAMGIEPEVQTKVDKQEAKLSKPEPVYIKPEPVAYSKPEPVIIKPDPAFAKINIDTAQLNQSDKQEDESAPDFDDIFGGGDDSKDENSSKDQVFPFDNRDSLFGQRPPPIEVKEPMR